MKSSEVLRYDFKVCVCTSLSGPETAFTKAYIVKN